MRNETVQDSEDELRIHPDASHISQFTEPNQGRNTVTPDTSIATPNLDANGRPKPRPRKKKLQTAESDPIASASIGGSSLLGFPGRSAYSDSIRDNTMPAATIADRAKSRTRSRPNYQLDIESVLSISSDSEGEPRRKKSKQKAKTNTKRTPSRLLAIVPDSQDTIPVPTSSFPVPYHGGTIPTSPLPPSDADMDPDMSMELPPIAHLPRSTSPLFTPTQSPVRVPPRSAISPPPFFASSSQQATSPPRRMDVPVVLITKKATKKRKKNDDDDDFDMAAHAKESKAKPKTKKAAQPKKKGKNAAAADDGVVGSEPAQKTVRKSRSKAKTKEPEIAHEDPASPEDSASHAPSAAKRKGGLPSMSSEPTPPVSTLVVPDSEEEDMQPVIRPSTKRRIIQDDDDDDEAERSPSKRRKGAEKASKGKGKVTADADIPSEEEPALPKSTTLKENNPPQKSSLLTPPSPSRHRSIAPPADAPSISHSQETSSSSTPRTEPRPVKTRPVMKQTPMSELIRRVNSQPGSPFVSAPISYRGTAYSPYLKSSKSLLSKIAPLHINRRTPPPPPPRPPPKKKTKKELEREEKWEEELVDEAGGINEWACLTDAERSERRKVKFAREMGGWED